MPEEWAEKFRDVTFGLPANYEDGSGEYWHAWFDRDWWKQKVAPNLEMWQQVYYAMTANLDWNVGRLLASLEEQGLAEDTIVVFTSDHGEMFGAHGRVQKNIFYEEAARVPFLVRWPGRVPEGAACDVCLNTPDIMPTLLSLMDVTPPEAVDGMDLSHWLLGEQGEEPEAAFLQGMGPSVDWDDGFEWRALRDKRFTYAIEREGMRESLFDHQEDPLQARNLIAEPEYAAVLARFQEMIQAQMDGLGDTFEAITWYRDRWTENGRVIRGARDLENIEETGDETEF